MTQINKTKLFDAFREDHAILGRGFHDLRENLVARAAAAARDEAKRIDVNAGAHIAFEEEDFYPALQALMNEGEVAQMYEDHADALELVKDVINASDDDLREDAVVSGYLRRIDVMEAHISECGELFGAMGGLADEEIKRLLQRLEFWRSAAPTWSEHAAAFARQSE